MGVVRINVTDDIRNKFLSEFAGQSDFKNRKEFAAHLLAEGLARLDNNGDPPGSVPRKIPNANGGNKSIEFDKQKNRKLLEDLEHFKKNYRYLSQPIANRACMYAALDVPITEWV